MKKKKINLTAYPAVSNKSVVKSFEQFLSTVQKSNCAMMSLHGLTVADIFSADRDEFPVGARDRISLSIMKLMRTITETRIDSTVFQSTQLLAIDMDRCVLVDQN